MNSIKEMTLAKKILLGIALILIIVILCVSWVEAYWYCVDKVVLKDWVGEIPGDYVLVLVTQEYNMKFLEQGLTAEDFNYSNIERVETSNAGEGPCLCLYLKKTGEKEAIKAVMHLQKLPFVYCADPTGMGWQVPWPVS